MKGARAMETAISVEGVSKAFGGVQALTEVTLSIQPGEIVGLIGPNGAGKSTLVHVMSGYLQPDTGRIRLFGHDITGAPPHRVAQQGLRRTFQKLRLGNELTVFDNVASGYLAVRLRTTASHWLPKVFRNLRRSDTYAAVMEALQFWNLTEIADVMTGILPYGQRHFVELARADVSKPTVLLLDEPGTGLTEAEKEFLMQRLSLRAREGQAVLLIDHDLDLVMKLCERIVVIDNGRVIFSGDPHQARTHPRVIEAYLGKGYAQSAEQEVGA